MTFRAPQNLYITLGLCSATAAVSAAPFTSTHGYTVTPPPGWHLSSTGSSGSDLVIFADKNGDSPPGTPVPNFGVRIGPQGKVKTLEIAKQDMVPAYQKGYPNLVVVSQTYSSLGGKPDLDMTFVIGSPGRSVRIRQVLVLQSGLVYFFTTGCPDKVHAKYDPVFAQILKSVRWKS